MKEVRSGMYVQHKYRDDNSSYLVRYIKDGKVYLSSKLDEYWFEENTKPSRNIIHRIKNFIRFSK